MLRWLYVAMHLLFEADAARRQHEPAKSALARTSQHVLDVLARRWWTRAASRIAGGRPASRSVQRAVGRDDQAQVGQSARQTSRQI